MRKLILLFILGLSVSLSAQSEMISTKKGDIKLTPVVHSTMVLEFKNKTIFVDPYGGAEKFTAFGAPDLVLITDIHGDHLNKETLGGLDLSKTTLVAPQAVIDQLGEISFKKVKSLANGGMTKWKGIAIEGVPMYNLPETEDSRHPKGRGNGYVLTMGKKRLYISGDTEDITEMRQLENIDVAFVCMNLPYTMTVEQAADAVLEFKPEVVYPFHYRGSEGLANVDQFKELVDAGNAGVEVRLRNWYPGN
ncbi:MBL fold metallo-hydrolase [Flavilitoribacter nigricans]|uniref:MBL fold metallo-hydrolase n=1 Tax=Flavilitoribacter nigricans (strain ATCC 23147 / DSM 23189 / NBRC 102662 / NCIMB 1420 / SS-2) TaxID=1122177 RepID=A0A2D0NJ22_FLAN2|nr:MBL fold metallo-hydrolase [Flavilitoribacter nigricans]PHN08390.1 MBL fold metallo-hydrolase [Flavilitoribacter nigricans DSM 23189 = NBRC 102662]